MKFTWLFLPALLACAHTTETNRAAAPESMPLAPKAGTILETTRVKSTPVLTKPAPQTPPKTTNRSEKTLPKAKSLDKAAPQEAALPAKLVETAGKAVVPTSPELPVSPAPSHAAWDALLQQAVSENGKVNYKTFKNNKTALEAYLKTLSDNPPQESWSRAEKMAYWINAYNAFTIGLIADNYPLASILKLDSGKTWDVKRIALGDKKYSLNQIENDILRPQYKDARIHFALNCAAKSCPPLYNRAFTAENLETNLEARTKAFLNNTRYNTITASKASLSKIFEWYAADFGELQKFLNRYANTPLKSGATIEYLEYDWDLNE